MQLAALLQVQNACTYHAGLVLCEITHTLSASTAQSTVSFESGSELSPASYTENCWLTSACIMGLECPGLLMLFRSKVGAAFDDKEKARKVCKGKYSLVDLDSFDSPSVDPAANKPT